MKYEVLKPFTGYGYIQGDILYPYHNGYAQQESNSPYIPYELVENNPEYFKEI